MGPGAADPPGSRPMAHPRITGTILGEHSGFGEDPGHPDAPHTPENPDPPGKMVQQGRVGLGGPAGTTCGQDSRGRPRWGTTQAGRPGAMDVVATADS